MNTQLVHSSLRFTCTWKKLNLTYSVVESPCSLNTGCFLFLETQYFIVKGCFLNQSNNKEFCLSLSSRLVVSEDLDSRPLASFTRRLSLAMALYHFGPIKELKAFQQWFSLSCVGTKNLNLTKLWIIAHGYISHLNFLPGKILLPQEVWSCEPAGRHQLF